MVGTDDSAKSPKNSGKFVEKNENLISPGFRSIAAMAGWDEEALLMASVIVEDTPDRQLKQKKRSVFNRLKTPPTNSNSRRKKRSERRSPASIPVAILDLDEDEPKSKLESEKVSKEEIPIVEVEEKQRGDKENGVCSAIPCLDRLREELSCAICLEICYEPSSTPCGHSFCKNCLRSAADRCGKKCPKCRQLISNGRYCTVNTVLWNTIQLLFPKEVEARKAADSASASNSSPVSRDGGRNQQRLGSRRRPQSSSSELPGQDRDAALALRLQREEFMERSSLATARANLRAMASRAINIRVRGRRDAQTHR